MNVPGVAGGPPDLPLAPTVNAPRVVVALAPVAAAGVAVVAIVHPVGLAAVVGLIGVGSLALIGSRVSAVFLGLLALILAGYALFGRGFAYVGVGSIYAGEVVLSIGVLAFIANIRRFRFGLFEGVLVAFMVWGAIRTAPYLGVYGIDALRDAVTWGYAAFVLIVATVLRPRHIEPLVRLYRRVAVPLVFWFPLAAVLTVVVGDRLPTVPGSDVPIIYFKAGDAGVHLSAIAGFLFVGLAGRSQGWTAWRESLVWIGWLLSVGLSGALNRGSMVAASMSVVALLFVRRARTWMIAVAVAVFVLSAAWVANPEVDLGISRRLSVQQFVENATSIVTATGDRSEGTKQWRIAWWESIVGYTVDGPYVWAGKGYGINLADDDGFQVLRDGSLRAPHSATFEFLARSGIPGVSLWLLLQALYATMILRAAHAASRTGQRFYLAVLGWIFIYWLAAFVNMNVDVYLGGPQGGIWFWSMTGVGVAVSRFVGDEKRRLESVGQELRPPSDDGDDEARDHRGVAAP